MDPEIFDKLYIYFMSHILFSGDRLHINCHKSKNRDLKALALDEILSHGSQTSQFFAYLIGIVFL